MAKTGERADITLMVSRRNYERLKHFGLAGDTMNKALGKVLDIAEKSR